LPKRSALIELFKLVDFHPLSIKLVAYQCKERRVGDLARSLAELLAAEPLGDKQRCLVASLNLSLQRLDKDLLEFLPRLGVFQGGALEFSILEITEIDPDRWQQLRLALVRTGLLQVEDNGLPFLRFHPILAPVLWVRLTTEEQEELRQRHQQHYYGLVFSLYYADSQNPNGIRSIVRQELANLIWSIKRALENRSDCAVDFVYFVNSFLNHFGLQRDRAFLTERLDRLVGTVGSRNWYLVRSSQGDQLFNAGQYDTAAALFAEVLQGLATEPSFDRVKTLWLLGKCLESQCQLPAAAECLWEALTLSGQLEQSDRVKQQEGGIYTKLGDVFRNFGKYSQAQQAYEDSLAIYLEIGDRRGVAVIQAQLGKLAMLQSDLTSATQRYQSAIETFQQLQEPTSEAIAWHQLGLVYQKCRQWTAADRAYRESARIFEQKRNMPEAASTYGQIAVLSQIMNKLTEAEDWYRKALQIDQVIGDRIGESTRLNNLANLLANQPNRLSEAYQLATRALEIKKNLDPAAASIWKIYNILERIATAQGETDTAREYRQLARTTKAAFAGTQYELQQHESFIVAVVAAVGDEAAQAQLEPILTIGMENGRGQLVAAIRRVLAGEREIEVLWDDLDADDSMIIAAILGRV
jgi:tetratricopeptide (TPR) repeat protein